MLRLINKTTKIAMSYKKFTKDIGLVGVTQLLVAISGIITLPIITKLLGAENYGIWTQIMVSIGLISTFANIQLPYALIRFLPGEKDKKEIQDGIWSVFVIISGILIAISVLLITFNGVISRFLGCSPIFIFLLAPIVIFDCLNFLLANVFRAFQEIKKYCYLSISANIAETILVVSTILLGYGLLGSVISILVVRIFFFLIMGAFIIKRVGITIPKFKRIKEYLSFCLPLIPVDVSYWVIQSSDKYFIGFFLGTLFVGYYAPAYTLGCCISFFAAPLSFLLPAILAKHHDENETDKVKTYIRYSTKYFLALAIPALFGLSILAKQLLRIFTTAEIAQHSYFIIPFVSLSMLLSGVCGIVTQNLLIKNKTKISGAIWMMAALLNFGLNFMFVPRFGILGAAITTLLAYFFVTAMGWYYSFKELKFEIDWHFIAKSTFASILMGLFVFLLNPVGLYKNILAIVFGALVYLVIIFLLRGFDLQELQFFKKVFENSEDIV